MASRNGSSLIELVVALLLLELAGAAALAAVLTSERLGRRASNGTAVDDARWEAYRQAETVQDCRDATVPHTRALRLPATAERDSLRVWVRCGH